MIIDTEKLDYKGAIDAIEVLKARANLLYGPYMHEQRMESMRRSQQRAENNKKLEAKALEDFATLMPGDIVKVTGVRDKRYPFREVTAVTPGRKEWGGGSFTGWQIRQLRDGSFERGSQHTDHMANKIRGVVHRATLELTHA